MATRRVDLGFNGTVRPSTGDPHFVPYTVVNSGSTQDPIVLVMLSAVVTVIKGHIRIPEDYVGTPVLSIVWTSETAANTVDFKFRHRTIAGSDTALLDISTSPTEREDTSVDNGGPSAPSERMLDTISLTTTDLTAGETMYYEFERDGVTDDKADDITIWHLDFQYSDT